MAKQEINVDNKAVLVLLLLVLTAISGKYFDVAILVAIGYLIFR